MPWDDTMLALGDALGHPREAARIVADTEWLFAGARKAHPEFEGRAVVVDTEPLSGALTWSTVLSLPLALAELVPVLAATLEG